MRSICKRLAAMLLCVCMLLSTATVYATEPEIPAVIEDAAVEETEVAAEVVEEESAEVPAEESVDEPAEEPTVEPVEPVLPDEMPEEPVAEESAVEEPAIPEEVPEEAVAEEPAEEPVVVEEVSEPAQTVDASVVYSGTCGENLTWTLDDTGTLTISGSGAMYDYTYAASAPWKSHGETGLIKKVVLEDGITKIGNYAFQWCVSPTSVTIPESVTSIGERAFEGWENLSKITIPDGVTEIGQYAFNCCSSLTKVTLPDGLESLGDNAFCCCYVLESVVIPDSVTELGKYVFVSCRKLTNVTLSKNIDHIGMGAFESCSSLTNITIPESVTSIDALAFQSSGLTSIEIPKSVTNIGKQAFFGTNLTEVVVPASVSSIGEQAFQRCNNLTKITFCGNAPQIGDMCFYGLTIDCYYPANNATWTTEVMQDYDGTITWIPYYDSLNAPVVKVSNDAATGKIKLSWNAVDGAAKYKIYRCKTKNGTYGLINTVTGTSTINKNAVAGQKYYYYVVAVASDGTTSNKSNLVYRTCDLARPVITLSNDPATGKVKVSWNAVDGAVKYQVYRCKTKDGNYGLMKTVTETSMINKNGVAGTRYYYKVVAVAENTNANSAASAIKNRLCDLASPVVSTAYTSAGKPKLTWDAIDGAVGYKIYRSTSEDGDYKLIYRAVNPRFTNTSAVFGTTYYYKIKAVHSNSNANSTYSTVVSIQSK